MMASPHDRTWAVTVTEPETETPVLIDTFNSPSNFGAVLQGMKALICEEPSLAAGALRVEVVPCYTEDLPAGVSDSPVGPVGVAPGLHFGLGDPEQVKRHIDDFNRFRGFRDHLKERVKKWDEFFKVPDSEDDEASLWARYLKTDLDE